MVAEQTAAFFLWGLTFKEFMMGAGVGLTIIFFLFKPMYDSTYERFLQGEKLTNDEVEAIENTQQNDESNAVLSKEKRRDYSLHLSLEQIKKADWSKKYTAALNKLLTLLGNLMGDHLPSYRPETNIPV